MSAVRTALGTLVIAASILQTGCSASRPDSGSTSVAPDATIGLAVNEAARSIAVAAGAGDPSDVATPGAGGEVAAWFESEGAPILSFMVIVANLWSGGSQACPSVVADLDALAPPGAIQGAVSAVPDQVTREVLLSTIQTALSALAACGTDSFDIQRGDLAWQWAVADGRLRQLGVLP